MLAEPLKEQLKARLRFDDPAYRYYKTIFNATTDMIAVTDGDIILPRSQAPAWECILKPTRQ